MCTHIWHCVLSHQLHASYFISYIIFHVLNMTPVHGIYPKTMAHAWRSFSFCWHIVFEMTATRLTRNARVTVQWLCSKFYRGNVIIEPCRILFSLWNSYDRLIYLSPFTCIVYRSLSYQWIVCLISSGSCSQNPQATSACVRRLNLFCSLCN